MKTLSLVSRICCFLCVALMLALIIIQFVPYWTVEEETVSMAEMIWFPTEHKDITKVWKKEMKALDSEFKMNGLVPMPILSMAAAGIGIFVCLFKNKSWGSALLPIISGGAMAYALMIHPIQKTGLHCQTFLILSIVTVAVAAVCLLTGIVASVMEYVSYKKAAKK